MDTHAAANPSDRRILNEVADLARLHEEAIAQHPNPTRSVFQSGTAILKERLAETRSRWPGYLKPAETDLLTRYLLSTSFIAAWYDLAGDQTKRDQAANSCATILAGLPGLEATEVLKQLMDLEREWRGLLSANGIGHRSFPLWSLVSLTIPAFAYWRAASAGAPSQASVGSALAQLGYVLAAAGLFRGTFGIFGLRGRTQVWIAAAVALGVGMFMINQ